MAMSFSTRLSMLCVYVRDEYVLSIKCRKHARLCARASTNAAVASFANRKQLKKQKLAPKPPLKTPQSTLQVETAANTAVILQRNIIRSA